MSGFKVINLNTANPYVIGGLIADYLTVGDYQTLKDIGLTQSVINDLVSGKKDWVSFDFLNPNDFIRSGEIHPPSDLDIPGDLLKLWWRPAETKNFFGWNRLPYLHIPSQYVSSNPLYRDLKKQRFLYNIPGENANLTRNYINPKLLDFETAPTVNTILSLSNAYGNHLSYLFTKIVGGFWDPGANELSSFRSDGIFVWLAGSETPTQPPAELRNIPFGFIPFGDPRLGHNLYYTLITDMVAFNNGYFSGYNYNLMQQIRSEGRYPYSRREINPATGTLYGVDEVIHDFALAGKFEVPNYLGKFRSNGYNGDQNYIERFYIYWSEWGSENPGYNPLGLTSEWIGHFSLGLYTVPLERRLGVQGDVFLELPDGRIVTTPGEELPPSKYYPFVEWPEVYNPSDEIHRPTKSPLGRVFFEGVWDDWIEFAKEAGEHYIAMREWFDAGCPCDWRDWGGYVDPAVEAEMAWQESVNISAGNKYIPAVTSAEQPPKNPILGDLWRDTVSGSTKVFTQINETTRGWVDQ